MQEPDESWWLRQWRERLVFQLRARHFDMLIAHAKHLLGKYGPQRED